MNLLYMHSKYRLKRDIIERDIYHFNEKRCPVQLKRNICQQITNTVVGNEKEWIVFIIRFSVESLVKLSKLANYIESNTGIKTIISSIADVNKSTHIKHQFVNKNTIVINRNFRFDYSIIDFLNDLKVLSIYKFSFEQTAILQKITTKIQ